MIDHIEFHETLKFIYELPFKMNNRRSFGRAYKGLFIPYISIILSKKKIKNYVFYSVLVILYY